MPKRIRLLNLIHKLFDYIQSIQGEIPEESEILPLIFDKCQGIFGMVVVEGVYESLLSEVGVLFVLC